MSIQTSNGGHRRRLGGTARARPSNNWETPMYSSVIASFPQYFGLAPNILNKSTPVTVVKDLSRNVGAILL